MADVQSNIKVSIDTTEALASIKNLQRQISAFHTSMAKGGAAANAVTSQMQQNLINSVNATGKFSAQMRTIKTTTESFTSSLEKNKFSMGEYFRYAGGASKTFGRLFKSEFETINKVARENVKDLQTQYIKMGRDANGAMKAIAVRPLSLDMNDLATKTMIASQKQAILNQLLKQGSTNLLNFGKNTQWAGRQLMVGFTIPLMAFGAAASKTFMDMETQAIRFKKVYGDLFTSTKESTAALEEIKLLGKEFTKYGIAVKDTVGLASEAAAAGFKGVDLQRQTAAATKLSILGQVESQKALETTIALQNAFSMSSADLATNIDFLNAVENQTVLSLDDMATAIPKAAPVIQQLGGDVKDLAFFMTAMKEGGINASEGANALKSGLASMINPTGKAAAMLNNLGINIKKIVLDNKGDLKKTVIDFATALNELDPLNRAQAIEQMFGKFQFARLSTLFANVTKEGTQASRVLDLAGSSIQELAALSEKELGMTSQSAMNKFKASVENLKLSLVPVGEEFLKAVTPIAEFVTKILDKFNNLGDGTKKVIVTLTAIVAGLGPVLLMTFGLLMNGVANIIKGFTFMKSLFNKTGQASTTLGTEVKYLNTEQRNAAAVAASLDQVHRKLAQTFSAEAASVDALTRAYQRSVAAQSMFMPTRVPLTMNLPTKRAKGKPAVVGGTGNKDSELALLMPGETVIPKKMSKKYGSLINGMIAGSIPGYEFGKPSPFSFGGKDFNIPQRSLPGIQRIITEAQSLSGVIGNIDDVIFTSLDRLSTEVGGSAKITAGKLQAALSPITDLARSTYAKQQTYSGNAGVVMAHGLPKTTLTPEQITGLEGLSTGTNFGPRLANRSGGPVTGLSNMVFPMPAGFNQDRMTGAEGAQWIGQNRSRFTSDIAAQAGLDPNDPDLLRFGTAVGKSLKSAAHKGVIVTQDDFEKIISDALEKEIFDVGKNTSAAVKTAFADAKKVSTIMYPEVSKASGRESYPRVAVPTAARGTTVAGVDLAKGSSYKNRAVDPAMNAQADKFTVESVRARVRQFFTKMHKGVEEEVKKVLDIDSPSKVTKKLGNETATGFVHGIKELNDDAKNAGRRIGSEIVGGASQSGRTYRKATRPQGAAPIGPDMPPGTIPLAIVGMSEKEKQKERNKRARQAKYANIKKVGSKFGGVQGSVGLMAANMALSAAPDFAGKNIIQSTMTGASMGMLFGPWGAAAGAAIGLVSSAIGELIEKQKIQKAMTEAAFKSSADMAMFFGNAVVDTTLKVGALSSSLGILGSTSQTSFGYTNQELASFNEMVNSLPEGNPLKDLITGLTDQKNTEKILETAKAFVTTQVAIGQIKPDQAQKSLDIILASSGKASLVGSSFINLSSQSQAVTQSLKNAAGSSVLLGTSLTDLVGAASNASSLAQVTAIIDGIAASGITAAEALGSMYNAYLLMGNIGAANSILNLNKIPGLEPDQAARAVIAASKGYTEAVGRSTNAKDFDKRVIAFLSDPKQWKTTTDTSGKTKAYRQQEEEASITKTQIDLLKKKKKIIDDQIKQQEKITNEIKRQNDYLDKQSDIDKQIVEAKIKGDYIGAAALLQEKNNNTIEFDQETEKSKLQEKSDALQAQIDALELKNAEIVDAISKAAAAQSANATANANKIITAIQGGYPNADKNEDGSSASKAVKIPVTDEFLDPYIEGKLPGDQALAELSLKNDLDPKNAFKYPYSKDVFEEYVRSRIGQELDKLENPDDSIVVSAIGSDGATYTFRAYKDGRFIRGQRLDTKTGKESLVVPTPTAGKTPTPTTGKTPTPTTGTTPTPTGTGRALGGFIRGAGTATSDSIPAYLSNGEYVIKADSVAKYGVGYFDALNAQKFGEGSIGGVRPTPSATSSPKTGMTSSFGSVNPSSKPTPAKTNPPKMELWDWKRQWEEANKQVINIPVSPITSNFATNSFTLNKQQRVELQSISKELIAAQVKAIIVQGHTDSVGSGKDNKILSQNRANAIAEYMSKFVPGTMFVPIGYGEYKPLVPNTTAENRSKNRRADLILPNKYKTIYPDFEPEKHKFIINLGKLEGPNGIIVGGGMFIDSFNPPKEALKTFGRANGGAVKGFSVGGRILGAGTATSDSIPAYLSNGEYVIKAASVNKYGTETFDALNAGKFAKGGVVHPWWKKPATSYDSNNQPTGSPYGRYWGELERLFQGSPIGFDKNGKPIFNTTGKDPWGGTEIPGLPFSGKVGQFSDYFHQLAEQPRKSSGPGVGIDKITPPLIGSGASAYFGGLLGGGGGMMVGYHAGGPVGHKHLSPGHMASNYKAPYSGPVFKNADNITPAQRFANANATDAWYKKDGGYYKNSEGKWVKKDPSLWETFTTGENWKSLFGGYNPGGPIFEETQKGLLNLLMGPNAYDRMNSGKDIAGGEIAAMTANLLLARIAGPQASALMRSMVEQVGISKGIPGLGSLLPTGSFSFLGKTGSQIGAKLGLAGAAYAIPNKINQINNYMKVKSLIKDDMWHGSQPTGGRGEEYLQGKNVLEGAETYDPHYGMGFFGTSSKSEAEMYASGYNSSTNWGEAFGSLNKITKAPFGKYVDFTKGTNSIKWQDYGLYKALGMEKDGYLGNYLTENLGDIMSGQNVTGSIMNRISDGQVPGDMRFAKWLAWSKPAGVETEEYLGRRFASDKAPTLLNTLRSKLSSFNALDTTSGVNSVFEEWAQVTLHKSLPPDPIQFANILKKSDLRKIFPTLIGSLNTVNKAEVLKTGEMGYLKSGMALNPLEVRREIFGSLFARRADLLAPTNTAVELSNSWINPLGVFSRSLEEMSPGSLSEKFLFEKLKVTQRDTGLYDKKFALTSKNYASLGMTSEKSYRDAILDSMGFTDSHGGNLFVNPMEKKAGAIDFGRIGESTHSLDIFGGKKALDHIDNKYFNRYINLPESERAAYLEGLTKASETLSGIKDTELTDMLRMSGYKNDEITSTSDIYKSYMSNVMQAIKMRLSSKKQGWDEDIPKINVNEDWYKTIGASFNAVSKKGKNIRPKDMQKFLSKVLGDVSLPPIVKQDLAPGLGGVYIPRFFDQASNYENLLPRILINAKGKTPLGTAVHETMHHFDLDVLHDSFKKTLTHLRKSGKSNLADEYESVFVSAENIQKGKGAEAFEYYAQSLNDLDSIAYSNGTAEAFADEQTFKAYNYFKNSKNFKDKMLASQIGNPYSSNKVGQGLTGYFNTYSQFEQNALQNPLRFNPSFLKGFLENSPNMPAKTKDIYAMWQKGLEKFNIEYNADPSVILNSPEFKSFREYINSSKLNKVKGYKIGGRVKGKGTATSDSIPAYLSSGEYVIKADSVKKYGAKTFDSLNAGRFANGGLVPHELGMSSMGSVSDALKKKMESKSNTKSDRKRLPAGHMSSQYDSQSIWKKSGNFIKEMFKETGRSAEWLQRLIAQPILGDPQKTGSQSSASRYWDPTSPTYQNAEASAAAAKTNKSSGLPFISKNNQVTYNEIAALRAAGMDSEANKVFATKTALSGLNVGSLFLGGAFGAAIGRTALEGYLMSKGITGLGTLLPQGSFPFLGATASKFGANATLAAMLGFGKPFIETSAITFSSNIKAKAAQEAEEIAGQIKPRSVYPPFVMHEGLPVPLHSGGPFGNDAAVFQGRLEDLSSLKGYATVIPTTPEGILSYILQKKPNNKKAQSLLNKINSDYQWGDPEVKGFLTDMLAASDMNPLLPQLSIDTISESGTYGLANLMAAIMGDTKAAASVASKREQMGPLLDKVVSDYVENARLQKEALYKYDPPRGGVSGKVGEAPLSRAERADWIARDMTPYVPPSAADVSMIRVFNNDFPRMDGQGNLFEPAVGFKILETLFGPKGFPEGTIGTPEQLLVARTSTHLTSNDVVASHNNGTWKPDRPFIVTTLPNLMHYNKKPEQIHSRDTVFLKEFGKPFVYSRKEGLLSAGFPLEEKDYIKKLIELGQYEEGKPLPLLAEDLSEKFVYTLAKPKYSESEINDILNQFNETPNLKPLRKITEEDRAKNANYFGNNDFTVPSYGGVMMTPARALQVMAVEKAKQQIGINEEYLFHVGGAHESLNAETLKQVAAQLGVRFSGVHKDTDIDQLNKSGMGYNPFANLLSAAKFERGELNEGITTKEKALGALLLNMRFGKSSSGKVYPREGEDQKLIKEWWNKYGIMQAMEEKSRSPYRPTLAKYKEEIANRRAGIIPKALTEEEEAAIKKLEEKIPFYALTPQNKTAPTEEAMESNIARLLPLFTATSKMSQEEKKGLTQRLISSLRLLPNFPSFASGGLVTSRSISEMYNLPSFATGIDYLPNDMIAQLHQGERVLTKEENKTYSSSAPTTNIININGSDLNKKEIAQAVMVELDRAKSKNNKTNMVGR